MTFLAPASLDAMYESSKLDHTHFVGSDIRQLIGEIRRLRETPQPVSVAQAGKLPAIPDDDADFTPDLARKIIAKYHEILADPTAVHLNMLRGGIAKPSWDQIKHLYPEQFTECCGSAMPPGGSRDA